MTNYHHARYGKALEITDPSEAKDYFDRLVSENMLAAGRARTRLEAETIERRRIARYIGEAANSRKERERAGRLFGMVPEKQEERRTGTSVRRAPSRPGPSVSRIASVDVGSLDSIVSALAGAAQKSESTAGRPRRDSWRPWIIASEIPPAGHIEWRPWQWIG